MGKSKKRNLFLDVLYETVKGHVRAYYTGLIVLISLIKVINLYMFKLVKWPVLWIRIQI
jgi:hypothetical protein